MKVNHASNNGNTPLHVAAGLGDSEMIGLLLGARGIDVNVRNMSADGATPLHLAIMHGKLSALCNLQGGPKKTAHYTLVHIFAVHIFAKY